MKELFKFCLILTLGIEATGQKQTSVANMALIPGSTFDMGTDSTDFPKLMERFGIKRAELFAEESPKHSVTIGSFYLDRTEVTNAQF